MAMVFQDGIQGLFTTRSGSHASWRRVMSTILSKYPRFAKRQKIEGTSLRKGVRTMLKSMTVCMVAMMRTGMSDSTASVYSIQYTIQ